MGQATGFPDYERLQLAASAELAVINSDWGLSPATSWLDTAGFGYIDIAWNTLGDTALGLITLIWATDPNGSNQIMNNELMPVASSTGAMQFPVIARWVQVTASLESGPGTDSVIVEVFGSTVLTNRLQSQFGPYGLCTTSNSISAGTNAQTVFNTTYQGLAVFTVHDATSAKWRCNIEFWDWLAGSWRVLCSMWGAQLGNAGIATVAIPPFQCRVNVYNLDTVAETIYVNVVVA